MIYVETFYTLDAQALEDVSLIYNYAEVTIRKAVLSEVDLVKEIVKEAYQPIKKALSRKPAALMLVSLRGQNGVISRVAVRNEFRGRRIGTMLVDYGENLLVHMNAQRIDIEIYGAVEDQVSFYERGGYVVTERLKRVGEEIVVMQKDLTEKPVEEED